jgi:hypothetical protein
MFFHKKRLGNLLPGKGNVLGSNVNYERLTEEYCHCVGTT